jgi:hypothetical protein
MTVSSQIVIDLARDPLRLEAGAPGRGVDRHCPERRLEQGKIIFDLDLRVVNMQHATGMYALKFILF